MQPRALHVWVTDVQVWGDRRAPGLLLGWRRSGRGGWEGWVIVAQLGIAAHGAGPYVRQGWVPAESIEPRPPPGVRFLTLYENHTEVLVGRRRGHYPRLVELIRSTLGDLVVRGPIDESDLRRFRIAILELTMAQTTEPDTGPREPAGCAVDLSAVTYLPGAAIGILVVARARARTRGRRLSVRTVSGSISDRLLRLLDLSYERLPAPA